MPETTTRTPSARDLVRSTLLAAVVAAALLVTVVWPAEFGLDITGVGTRLGLTEMGKVKASLGGQAGSHSTPGETVEDSTSSARDSSAIRSDVTEIDLRPDQGKEIKLIMEAGARTAYVWSAVGGRVDFEAHGEPFDAPADTYESYEKGSDAESDEGVLTAPFGGTHGWYWRNRGPVSVKIRLQTLGPYREVRIME